MAQTAKISGVLLCLYEIKLMISLKLEHSHSHLPCHPTRAYLEEQASINETDREHLSQDDTQKEDMQSRDPQQFKIIESRAFDTLSGAQLSVVPRKPKPKRTIHTLEDAYSADIIEQSFQGSIKALPINIRSLIMQKQKLVEDKVYLGAIDEGKNLLGRLYDQIDNETHLKDMIKLNLIDLMADIHSKFETQIRYSDQYVIHKIIRSSKDDILSNRKPRYRDTSSLTFNSERTREKGEEASVTESQNPSHEQFSLGSQKTKKAEEFIKKIQKEQEHMRKKRKEDEQKKKSLQVRSMEEKKQFQEEIKSQRRKYLKRRIEAKQEIREKQLQVRERMNKEYKQFLQKYKKRTPLFLKKQHNYSMLEEDEKKKHDSILQKIKEERRPMRIQQILEHQQKYQAFKMDKQEQKNAYKRLKEEEMPKMNYYKSKCHEEMLKEEEKEKQRAIKEDPKLIRSELIKKRDKYSRSVRENYLPKGDESKQKQLQDLIKKLQWSQQLKSGKIDDRQHYAEGNKNLQRLHELIADLRSKGKLPPVAETISYDEESVSTKPQYQNYLQEVRKKRRTQSIDFDRIAEKDFEQADRRAKKVEQQAKRRQIYLTSGSLDVQRSLQQTKKLDDEYLESVKTKVAILNKLK